MLIHKETEIKFKLNETCEELYLILHKYCLSITNNHWDADDLTHATIAKTLSFYAAKQEPNITIALLCTIARNHWVDELRKNNKLHVGQTVECSYADPQSDQLQEVLDQLMERLTPKQLIAYIMKESFLYPLSEIANKLQIKETAVKALLYRARQKSQNYSGDFNHHWLNIRQDRFKSRLLQAIKCENPTILEELIKAISQIDKHVTKELKTPISMMFQPFSTKQMAA
jgi:RNA polymerase sigma factor (sigma-70 family)